MPSLRHGRSAIAGLTLLAFAVATCGGAAATPVPTAVEITAAPTVAPTPAPATSAPSQAAAASGAAGASPAVIDGTTGKIVNETDGYDITLPEGWLRIDMNAQDMAAVMQSAAGLSDDMATMMQNQAATMALSGVDFWAINTRDVGAGFASNANIIKQPSLQISLDLIEQLSVNQLESLDMLGGRKVAHDRVQLPSGEALHLRYEVGAKDAANTAITATIVQYLLARDDGQYILTVTGADGDVTAAAAESMATSWSFPG